MSVFSVPAPNLTDSVRQFVIPNTIRSDYHNWLYKTGVPNMVYEFRVLSDWYDQFSDKEKVYLRADYYPINWKSKVGNSDTNKNFETDFSVTRLHKGDIVIREEDGLIAMLNWDIEEYINSQRTQAGTCNHRLTVTRHVDAVADKRGFKIFDAGDKVIVDDLPCVIGEYAGRPDWQLTQNNPGIHADMLTTIDVQYNSKTKDIQIGDKFRWIDFEYVIINMSYAQVDINNSYGIITFNARRVAGEDE